ncbi:N-6 DNA methylase [Niveispirillum sp. SYP-B3756]|uniref:class I SAM-dependent DNA methyltransferase n=1 Tax=Niveispirillum sp. SYP-B3756 TaxID=2662178 RepID=UPI001291FACE|nr:DNA methyltransferase [Niveispirillum sp. SYP-B3756]MQP64234.1 N-6 DNA methylase [Niveispirillum sp. SYP-B3756]
MNPEDFIAKWRGNTANEKKFYQSHFNDLCRMLEVPDPNSADKTGEEYCFEKNVLKLGGASGYADVWKRNHFVWEYKGSKKNLTAAHAQVKQYADALGNPPLLIVSDSQEIRIHTNFTNEVAVTHTIRLGDLMSVEARRMLRACWTDPEYLRPKETRATVTAQAAATVGTIAAELRHRLGDEQSRRIAHFLNRIVFCLFAQNIGLLPDLIFSDLLEDSVQDQAGFAPRLKNLFRAMKDPQGYFGNRPIPWFNGGLFDDDDVIDLGGLQIRALLDAAKLDWGSIEPSIFGTLFERGLDPEKRKAMAGLFDVAPDAASPAKAAKAAKAKGLSKADKGVGIHYTDPEKIMKIVEPVVLRPLRAEWEQVKEKVAGLRAKRDAAKDDASRTRHENAARDTYLKFRHRLGKYRVLDPACGSGNFLYMALMHLKDLDRAIEQEARTLGLPADDERITPQCVLGIEINPYAAELARTTVWIGELQWQMKNAGAVKRTPILGSLKGIENRDALLNEDGTEAQWPKADAIVGNPPFLGSKKMRSNLGEVYVDSLRAIYKNRVSGQADLVSWWFVKALYCIKIYQGRFGFVATNTINHGDSLETISRNLDSCIIFDAWESLDWVLDGAAVDVAICCIKYPDGLSEDVFLNGNKVSIILPGLKRVLPIENHTYFISKLRQNINICLEGYSYGGPFVIKGDLARRLLNEPLNPNGKLNSDVISRMIGGAELIQSSSDYFVIDFGTQLSETEAAYYEAPFTYLRNLIFSYPQKEVALKRDIYWRFRRSGAALRHALAGKQRFIAVPKTSKYRLFRFVDGRISIAGTLNAIARDDYTSFGILHSSFHAFWALYMGSKLEDRPRYTPTTCFETFPFPEGLTPDLPASAYADDPRAQAIAAAAKELDEKREAWLNPPDLVKIVPEVVPGYPDRILPKNDKAAAELKKRTLTNLYNQRPAWLDMLHKRLDEAVAAAYGWPANISEEEALAKLFALNQERAAKQEPKPKGRKHKEADE